MIKLINRRYSINKKRDLTDEEKNFLCESVYAISSDIKNVVIYDKYISVVICENGFTTSSKIKKTVQLFCDYINFENDILYQNNYERIDHSLISTMKELVDNDLVYETADGVYLYKGLLAELYERIDEKFESISLELGAKKVIFPSLLKLDILSTSKYLNNHQEHCQYVFDSPIIEEKLTLQNDKISALTPAVCQPLYASFANKVITEEICTGYSKCFRNEKKYNEDLSRLKEYGIRETVYIGTEKNTKEFRDRMLSELISEIKRLNLFGTIESASDAFFSSNSLAVKMYQLAMNVKYEAKLDIPYNNDKIAISSVNYHGDYFGRCWNIRTADGEYAHSCCWGVGIDRLCYAIISQFGIDRRVYQEYFGI